MISLVPNWVVWRGDNTCGKETFWQLSSPLTFAATAFCRAKCWLPDSSSSGRVRDTRECEAVWTIATAATVGCVMAILGSNRWNTNAIRVGRQRRTFWLEMKSTITILFLMTLPFKLIIMLKEHLMMWWWFVKISEDNHTDNHHH